MNFTQIKTTLESALATFWTTTTPIAWENIAFNDNDSEYIVPEVTPQASTKLDFGCRNGGVEIQGTFNIRIVGQVDSGAVSVMTKADSLANHFSDTVFSGVYTRPAEINVIGVVDNRYQVNVAIPFVTYQRSRT